MRIISTVIFALLILAAFVSASHIVDTASTLGLSGWYRYAAVALIDFVAIVGKLSMHVDFLAEFRKSGFRLLMAGGTLSLFANVYAGDNPGEKAFGALTVGAFMLLEHHASKAGKAAIVVEEEIIVEIVAPTPAEKAAATRKVNAAARAAMTPGQKAAATRKANAAKKSKTAIPAVVSIQAPDVAAWEKGLSTG
jgi:hypothetical protein